MPVWLLFSFAGIAPDPDVSWRSSEPPNPYALLSLWSAESPLAPDPPPFPEPAGGRRWFAMEDSGDMMGLPLSRNAVFGLQVELTGPSEDQHPTRPSIDPYHPRFLLTTAGVRIQF
jgi:hypothetical protein